MMTNRDFTLTFLVVTLMKWQLIISCLVTGENHLQLYIPTAPSIFLHRFLLILRL